MGQRATKTIILNKHFFYHEFTEIIKEVHINRLNDYVSFK